MIAQPDSAAERLIAVSAVVATGVLVALLTTLALTIVQPVYLYLVLGGIVVFLPTFVLRDPRAYWLFLLFVSIPIDIYKRTTGWIADPFVLLQNYGLPAVETLSLDLYLTDIVLFFLIVPWLARLCLKRESFYFPKIGYIYVLFLVYSLFVSLIRSVSFYLSIFEWCRELLYFLSFLYIVNNVVTRSQLRAIVLALFAGLIIESGTIITLYYVGIGTEKPIFSALYSNSASSFKVVEHTHYAGESDAGAHIKRSPGTFGHPALAAYYLEYILPVVLAHLVAARSAWYRVLHGAIFAGGCAGLYLTFSRSGLAGFVCGSFALFPVARWSRLISRRAFEWYFFIFMLAAALATPLVIVFLLYRPEAAHFRVELVYKGLRDFWERPIFGAGLNNATAVMEGARRVLPGAKHAVFEKLHVHYLVVLVEGGLVGFLLFFGFFWQIAVTALRSMRAAETELKLLLVGIVAAMADIAVHNFGDPFQGHVTSAMLWLYAGLVVAISRRVQTVPA